MKRTRILSFWDSHLIGHSCLLSGCVAHVVLMLTCCRVGGSSARRRSRQGYISPFARAFRDDAHPLARHNYPII
jgi:hypothetical protein